MVDVMSRPFERVYAVTNFLDQVRNGIAAFDGVPHTFDAVFVEADDEYLPDTCEV